MIRVVIVGGGFGGARTVRKLRNNKQISVTLINETSDFRYSPAIYRAATGHKLGMVRLPLEWMLLGCSNAELVVGKAQKLDTKSKTISLDTGETYEYDYAVFSLGSITSYFGIKGLDGSSYGVKTPHEILELRRHLHSVMTQKKILEHNVVIVGGGPTGTEIAGAMQSYLNRIANNHQIRRPHHINVVIVEAAQRLLPTMLPKVSQKAQRRLTELGVKIMTNTKVEELDSRGLVTSSEVIKSHTVIWTAGTTINPFYDNNRQEFDINEHHKITVNERLQVEPSVYVIGDNAATPNSGTALTAVQHANFVAGDITSRVTGRKRPKKYHERSVNAIPVGESWAIIQYRKFVLSGRLASWLRRAADYIGYSDVLGVFRALTVWSYTDSEEQSCQNCQKKKRSR
jgi:NADH dehydrogenase